MQLRIGHLSTCYHTAMLLMADRSLCSGIHADLTWSLFGTHPAIITAFEKGDIDLAYIGLPPAIIGIARGVPIICVAGGHVEGTVLCSKSHYRGYPERELWEDILKQFRGMTIGVPGRGSIHDVILQDSLKKAELADDIAVRNFPWADMAMEAVIKDEVAAAFGTPALAIAIKRYAGGKILYPPSKLWPNNPSYGILVSRDYLSANETLVAEFLQAHEAATARIRSRPAETAARISEFVGFVDAEFVLETLTVSPKYCSQITDQYVASTISFVSVLKDLGYIRNTLRADELFNRSLVNKVHPEPDHYDDGICLS